MVEEMINLSSVKKAYFIGIKGVGMTALAQVLKGYGIEVLGSDKEEKFFTDEVLEKIKVKVIEKFNSANIPDDIDLVVVSAAYYNESDKDQSLNVEVEEAIKRNLPILTYAQVLGMIFDQKYGIAISGTHGKSTTTAMLGVILEQAGLDPTVIVGTRVLEWQSNARVGKSKYLVAEADEYRDSFSYYSPRILVITSLEYDHPDFFKTFDDYKNVFREMVKKIPQDGFIIANTQDKVVLEIIKQARCPVIEYGPLDIELRFPGEHNQLNASAALEVGLKLGLEREQIKKSLANFKGTSRRFEIKGEKDGILFIDDYAHHPTEVKATLKAAKGFYPNKKIWAIFQPHTFTRTQALLDDFGRAFNYADFVIVLDIYGSSREKIGKVHAKDLVKEIKKHKKDGVRYIATIEQADKYLKEYVKKNQVVLTMGAGDVWRLSTID